MALQPCPECGREISTTATSCPHCGAKTRSRRLSDVAILLLVAALVLVVGTYCFLS